MYVCDSLTQWEEAASSKVQNHPQLHKELEVNLGDNPVSKYIYDKNTHHRAYFKECVQRILTWLKSTGGQPPAFQFQAT